MPTYKPLSDTDGEYYLDKVECIVLKPIREADFFVQPWDNRELRAQSNFIGSQDSKSGRQEILFCTKDPQLVRLLSESDEVYPYGAYNQVTVCQMRARCGVTQIDTTSFQLHALDYAYNVYERG